MSAPMLPSTKSLPGPPISTSAPLLPSSVSLPAPPSMVSGTGSTALKTRTSSSPAPAFTATELNVLRSSVKSAVPSSPTSAISVVGVCASASLSLALSPVSWSVVPVTFAV